MELHGQVTADNNDDALHALSLQVIRLNQRATDMLDSEEASTIPAYYAQATKLSTIAHALTTKLGELHTAALSNLAQQLSEPTKQLTGYIDTLQKIVDTTNEVAEITNIATQIAEIAAGVMKM